MMSFPEGSVPLCLTIVPPIAVSANALFFLSVIDLYIIYIYCYPEYSTRLSLASKLPCIRSCQ